MKKFFKKFQRTIIRYRSYKNCSNDAYRKTLINELSSENSVNNDNCFQRFCNVSLETLNKHASCKKKQARGN